MGEYTSVTDQPITTIDEESLDIQDYANALSEFIQYSATPLTIGIQGVWGSGKTSLMYLLQTQLMRNNVATAWVNTWEYSLFRSSEETTPEILHGLLESLKESCAKYWPPPLSDRLDKVGNVLKGLSKLAVDAAVLKATGLRGASDRFPSGESVPEGASRTKIAEIKKEIATIIQQLIEDPKNSYHKAVFFIDDLDRIEPSVAVETLEALKNIFDVKNTVFVLAVDYDVVVKGLRGKFGEMTPGNEREFRSFFDKIIQVPFTMPLSSYNIEKLLLARFDELGIKIDQNLEKAYRDISSFTVGSNPRSIKRYINTYSLLRRIRDINQDESSGQDLEKTEYALFALIGIQIAFPEIYKFIIKEQDFVHGWTPAFAAQNDVDISLSSKHEKGDLLDEEWKQFVWSACQKDMYLKANLANIISALDSIRNVIKDENLASILGESMQVANITSVEDSRDSSSSKFQRVRFDGWDNFYKNRIAKGASEKALKILKFLHDYIADEYEGTDLRITYTGAGAVTFKAMSAPKRRKVFAYSGIHKDWARFGCFLASGEWENTELKKPEDLTDEVKEKIRKSQQLILDGEI